MLKLFGFVIRQVKKIERSPAILLLASGAIGIFSNQPSTLSQPKYLTALNSIDFVCYIQTGDGRVMNLSKLCGSASSNATALSATDQRFLDRYQALLRRRAGLPAVQTALLQAQQNPQAVLQRAQDVCTTLRTGQPQAQTVGQVGDDLFATMAPKYYCPDLDD